MTNKEAFDIVLSLAIDNMVDEDEMPEIWHQQSDAIDRVILLFKQLEQGT